MEVTWFIAFCSLTFTQCILEVDTYTSKDECFQRLEEIHRTTGVKSFICIPVEEDKLLKFHVE